MTKLFSRFEQTLRNFNGNAAAPELLLGQEGALEAYYAPLDVTNPRARITLVGITPGLSQASQACEALRLAVAQGMNVDEARRLAKNQGAFAGAMRKNLEDMLEFVGVVQWLGLRSARELMDLNGTVLHTTSVLPFPVLHKKKNYNGTPSISKSPMLRGMMLEHFAPQAMQMPGSVFLPLGPVAAEGLQWLVERGHVKASNVLPPLPHPSPASNERIQFFLGTAEKAQPSPKTDLRKLLAMREAVMAAVAVLHQRDDLRA